MLVCAGGCLPVCDTAVGPQRCRSSRGQTKELKLMLTEDRGVFCCFCAATGMTPTRQNDPLYYAAKEALLVRNVHGLPPPPGGATGFGSGCCKLGCLNQLLVYF